VLMLIALLYSVVVGNLQAAGIFAIGVFVEVLIYSLGS